MFVGAMTSLQSRDMDGECRTGALPNLLLVSVSQNVILIAWPTRVTVLRADEQNLFI